MIYAFKVAIHLALVFSAFLGAYQLRRGLPLGWWFGNPDAQLILVWGALYVAIAALVEFIFRVERTSWRFSSAREVLKLARSSGVTAILFLVLVFLGARAISLPRSTLVLSFILNLFALVSVRLMWRAIHDRSLIRALFGLSNVSGGAPLILAGDVRHAENYLRRDSNPERDAHQPVAILPSDDSSLGALIHGVPVISDRDDPVKALSTFAPSEPGGASILFLDDPIGVLGFTAEQIGRLKSQGFALMRQPSVIEMQGEQAITLREIKLEEFLPRAPVTLAPEPITQLISGRRVLVTGAGGSIGSEIARQLVGFGCGHITLVDHSEFQLFEIDREIAEAVKRTGASRAAVLCNVRDGDRVSAVMKAETPDIVFHAAALKHVTLVENNPGEGVLTNVIGTWNVAQGARDAGARQMVLISTDKAVSPSNVMGATKRIAEATLAAMASAEFNCCAVRFGNVLGSAGSVVPIFKDQIERGGPVTITDEAVERYFMTIPEAVQLVLQATVQSASTHGGLRKFVLEMGQPVKIIDLARQMIELSGRIPGADIKIEVIGLRPGEKLTEDLIDETESSIACIEGVNEIKAKSAEIKMTPALLAQLAKAAAGAPADGLRDLIYDVVARARGGEAPVSAIGRRR